MLKLKTSDRLKQLIKERNLKQVDILDACKPYCKKYGIKLEKNDLSQYVSGKVIPKQNKLSILGMALNVNEAWLMGYDVPKERDNPINNKFAEIADIFNSLKPEFQNYICAQIKQLLDLQNKNL